MKKLGLAIILLVVMGAGLVWTNSRKGQTINVLGQSPILASTSDEFTLVAAGDIACDADWMEKDNECHQRKTADLIEMLIPDAVLALGDLHYTTDEADDFLGYDQSWGRFRDITYPAPGNHEYGQAPGAKGYFDYWGSKAEKGWYSVNLGEWHVVALNSNFVTGEQTEWLRKDLQGNEKKCSLAFMHHPRFSSGWHHGNNSALQPWWELMSTNGVDVVLAGHEHNYERFGVQNGVRQFVVGTGGRSLYGFGSTKANSEVRISEFGMLKLILQEKNYEWEFVKEMGEVLDRGYGECN